MSDSTAAAVGQRRGWLTRHAYGVLAAAVLVLVGIQTLGGQWSSDMWEHVAVVRELRTHPFDPTHPQLALDAPHPGFSPYAVVLGLLGTATGAEARTVLSVAALANVGFLLAAWRWLVVEVTGNRRAPVWALLAVLALWGPRPYRYSGFFNLNSIGFVAPFPSTCAAAAALATLAAGLRYARGGGRRWLVLVAAGAAFVTLTHPLSAPWLAAALLVVALTGRLDTSRLAGWGVAAGGAIVICLLWPYFSFLDLVTGSGSLDDLNLQMYDGVLPRIAPLLLGLPVLLARLRRDPRDVLALWFMVGGALYAVGAIVDNSSLGRTLAFLVLVLAIALGDWAGRKVATSAPRQLVPAALAAGLLVAGGLWFARGGIVRMVPPPLLPTSVRDDQALERRDEPYAFLGSIVGRGDVVVGATREDERMIPAIAGRVLTLVAPRPFVADLDARLADRLRFLDPSTPAEARAEIARRRDVRYVLLHDRAMDRTLREQLVSEGATVIAADGGSVLLAWP